MSPTLKTGKVLLASLSALLAVTGCGDRDAGEQPQGNAAPDTGGTAVIALANEPDILNGLLSGERWGQEINRNLLYLTLLDYNAQLELVPRLARAWQMHGDTAVVFQLHNDVRWHDGRRTTAHDVAFTYQRGSDPATAFPNADYWAGWSDVQVLDSFTVRFRLTPQPEVLANLPWIPIMPRHLLQRVPAARMRQADFNQRPIGNGPFRFVEHRANDRWVFEANRDFSPSLGGRPYLDRVVLRIIPEQTAQETEIIAGNVDLITAPRAERFNQLDARPDLKGIEKPGRQYVFVGWNMRRPPLDDARVRRALTMGIDRARIVQVLRAGKGRVAVGPVPPYHWSYDQQLQPLPYSPDSARALLAAAGLRDRNGDGFLEGSDGQELRIELKHAANNEFNRNMAEMIRSDLASVGVRVVTRPVEFNTMVGDVSSPTRNFDAFLMGWQSDFRLVLRESFHSSAINNPFQFASYRNPAVDSLLDRLATTTSRAEARPLWQRFQSIIRNEQPWSFLYYYTDLLIARERLQLSMDIRGIFNTLPLWWVTQPDTVSP